jgi:hypothetical protein
MPDEAAGGGGPMLPVELPLRGAGGGAGLAAIAVT